MARTAEEIKLKVEQVNVNDIDRICCSRSATPD
jgi:hypothetical protein